MNSVEIHGVSRRSYKVIDYTIGDDGLRFAGEYVDALNLSRMIGCFRDDAFVRKIIIRLTAGISNRSYSNIFGFNHIVYESCYRGMPYACYKPHDWTKGDDEKTMVTCLRRFLRGLKEYHANDEGYVEMMKSVEDFRDE